MGATFKLLPFVKRQLYEKNDPNIALSLIKNPQREEFERMHLNEKTYYFPPIYYMIGKSSTQCERLFTLTSP